MGREVDMKVIEQVESRAKSLMHSKKLRLRFNVIPAKAGIQRKRTLLDPGFRRGDDFDESL